MNEYIFGNKYISCNGKPLDHKLFKSSRILYEDLRLKGFLDHNGHIQTFQQLKHKFDWKLNIHMYSKCAINQLKTSCSRFLNIFILFGKHYLNFCRTDRKNTNFVEFLSIAKSRIKYYKIILQKAFAYNDKKLLDRIENINWSP